MECAAVYLRRDVLTFDCERVGVLCVLVVHAQEQ